MRHLFWVYLLWGLWTPVSIFSQEKTILIENQPLSHILGQVEKFYKVKFSYTDAVLNKKNISIQLDKNTLLPNFIKNAELQTQLRFEVVTDKYIVIRPFKASDSITICGYITNTKNQPLSGVTISLKSKPIGVITDKDGFFKFENIPYTDYINIQYIGYKKRSVFAGKLHSKICIKLRLKEALEWLDEISVQNYLAVGIHKIDHTIVLEPQKLGILPGLIEPDVLKSIQLAPGINSPFETATGIHVRGGTPDQNLVLWNGIKTYNQGHFFGMLSAFNPYIIKKVDFIKNGTPAEYGDRVSGVIDIKTEDTVANSFSGGAGFNMLNADAFINLPIIHKQLSVQISGRRSLTDYIETPTYNPYSKKVFQNTKINTPAGTQNSKNDFFFSDLNSTTIFKPSKNSTFLINTLYNQNSLDFSSEDITNNQQFNDVLDTENEGYNFKWSYQTPNPNLSINTDAYYTKYFLSYLFKNTENDTTDIASKKNSIRDFGLHLNTKYEFSNTQKLQLGYQFSKNKVAYAFEEFTPNYSLVLDQNKEELDSHAFYSEYQYLDPTNTHIKLGLRFNSYPSLKRITIEPRIYAQQYLGHNFKINGSIEYRTQTVSQIKESVVSDLSLENQVWTLASKKRFPIIDSYQLTFGASYKKQGWLLDFDSYYKNINNITTLTFGFLNPISSEFRVGNSAIYGVDVFLKKEYHRYKSWLSYSYIHTQNHFNGLNNNASFPGNWNIKHTVKWSHFFNWKSLQFSAGWWWHTGKSFTDVEQITSSVPVSIQYGALNGNQLPVYHRLDVSATYDFTLNQHNNIHYRVGLSILNLYNRKNLLNREFSTTPSLENELLDNKIYSLGITPNLVFRMFW